MAFEVCPLFSLALKTAAPVFRAYPLSMESKAGSKFLFDRASLPENRSALFRTHSSGPRASGPEKESAAPHRSEGQENGAGDKPSLEGRRILVVEDEFLLALEVEAALMSFGCFVAGPFAKLGKALVAARATRLDGAVLDINLNGEMVYPLAEFLDLAGVPLVFLTGYVPTDLPERFRRFRRLQKPLHAEKLRHIIRDMLHGGTGGGGH